MKKITGISVDQKYLVIYNDLKPKEMTSKINNQPANSIAKNEFSISSSLKLPKITKLNIRYDAAPQQSQIKVKEAVIRRYSFDDNGGGYLGL